MRPSERKLGFPLSVKVKSDMYKPLHSQGKQPYHQSMKYKLINEGEQVAMTITCSSRNLVLIKSSTMSQPHLFQSPLVPGPTGFKLRTYGIVTTHRYGMQGLLALFSSSRNSLKLSPGLASVWRASSFLVVALSSLEKLFFKRVMDGCASPFNNDMRVQRLCISSKC